MPNTSLLTRRLNSLRNSASLKSRGMFVDGAIVVAGNLLVLREPLELRNLPRLPIKKKFYLVLKMVKLRENINSFIVVMFQDRRGNRFKAWSTLPPEKSENKSFNQETHQMFSVYTTPEEFKQHDNHRLV